MLHVGEIKRITDRISMGLLGNNTFTLRVDSDLRGGERIFLQIVYKAPCSKTGECLEWRGRKWYLSEYMLEQEVIFTVYTAYKMAIEHEIMESFKVDNITLVNPHVNYKMLLEISEDEIKRGSRVVDEDTGVVIIS